jgi:hypothetical protein
MLQASEAIVASPYSVTAKSRIRAMQQTAYQVA